MTFSKHRFNVYEIVFNTHVFYIIQNVGYKSLQLYPERLKGKVIAYCFMLHITNSNNSHQ